MRKFGRFSCEPAVIQFGVLLPIAFALLMKDSLSIVNARFFTFNESGNDCQWGSMLSSRGQASFRSAGEGLLRRRPFWILSPFPFSRIKHSSTNKACKQILDLTSAWQCSRVPEHFIGSDTDDGAATSILPCFVSIMTIFLIKF